MADKPLIGISLERRENGDFNRNHPFLAMEAHYFDMVTQLGGVPVGLNDDVAGLAEVVARLDGVLSPGGAFFTPTTYPCPAEGFKTRRVIFEAELLRHTLAQNKPLLAICAGMQVLSLLQGGSVRTVAEAVPGSSIRHVGVPKHTQAHVVHISEGSLLHRLAGCLTLQVNSHHRECVVVAGEGLQVSALADDGVIEALEVPGKRFALAVQWHPEHMLNHPEQKKILQGFIDACTHQNNR